MEQIKVSRTTSDIIELKKQLQGVCDNIVDFLHEFYPSEDECEAVRDKVSEIDIILNGTMTQNMVEELAGSGFRRI